MASIQLLYSILLYKGLIASTYSYQVASLLLIYSQNILAARLRPKLTGVTIPPQNLTITVITMITQSQLNYNTHK